MAAVKRFGPLDGRASVAGPAAALFAAARSVEVGGDAHALTASITTNPTIQRFEPSCISPPPTPFDSSRSSAWVVDTPAEADCQFPISPDEAGPFARSSCAPRCRGT